MKLPERSALLVGPPDLGLDGTPRRDLDAEKTRAEQLNALGAALFDARRNLIHAQALAEQLGAMGAHRHGAAAVLEVDEAAAEVVGEMGES